VDEHPNYLLRQYRTGDNTAGQKLIARFSSCLFQSAFTRLNRDQQLAEDLVHDAFITLIDSSKEFESYEHLRAWLLTVIRNLVYRELYRLNRARSEPLIQETHDIGVRIENGFAQNDLKSDLAFCMSQLSEPNRIILQLKYSDNLENEIIAVKLNIPPSVVPMRLTRARQELGKLMSAHGWGPEDLR
jgi:RNA polymerase sigma factor (sigma-70 family)